MVWHRSSPTGWWKPVRLCLLATNPTFRLVNQGPPHDCNLYFCLNIKGRNHTVMCSNRITMYTPPLFFLQSKQNVSYRAHGRQLNENLRGAAGFSQGAGCQSTKDYSGTSRTVTRLDFSAMSATWCLAAFFFLSHGHINPKKATWKPKNGGSWKIFLLKWGDVQVPS